jgi:hypothetical protein
MSGLIFDLELLKNNTLFQKIKEQSDLVEDLFLQLGNEFPQKDLLKIHENSKGTKISKGYNLGNSPYQVLDLIRDFDEKTGFNIRVLNWWGNGLYIFAYFGQLTFEKHIGSGSDLPGSYQNCNHPSPWAYGEIISKVIQKDIQEKSLNPENKGFIQFFKQIEPYPDFTKTYNVVKKEIRFILDYHY